MRIEFFGKRRQNDRKHKGEQKIFIYKAHIKNCGIQHVLWMVKYKGHCARRKHIDDAHKKKVDPDKSFPIKQLVLLRFAKPYSQKCRGQKTNYFNQFS